MNNTAQAALKSGPWWMPPRNVLLAMLAGLLVTLGLPPLVHTGILVPVGLAVLFVALKDARRPARLLWIFALVHQTSLLHWLFLLIPAKTIPTDALIPIQASAAILYVTVFYLLLGWVFALIRRRLGHTRAILLMPILWTAMEAWRARGEMAFPWCLSGSAVVGGPLMPLLRTCGEIGLSALMVMIAVLLALLWDFRRQGGASLPLLVSFCGTLVLFMGLMGGSLIDYHQILSQPKAEPLVIAAIQADVDLDDKWKAAKIDSTRLPYEKLTLKAAAEGAQFVIWAETAMPAYIRHDTSHLNWLRSVVRRAQVSLYTGFPDAERMPDGKMNKYNSSGLFAANGTLLDRYAKHHLLPIGEAMPFTSLIPALAKIDVGQAEWTPGLPPEPMLLPTQNGEFAFSGLICFESILAAQARDSVRRGSRCLMVLTNDGWFGKTAGPRQHTQLALLRAAECGVPMVRCANNGISLICDDRGRVQDQLGLGKKGFVKASVTPGGGGTVYVKYGAWPLLWFLVAWLVLVLGLPGLRRNQDA